MENFDKMSGCPNQKNALFVVNQFAGASKARTLAFLVSSELEGWHKEFYDIELETRKLDDLSQERNWDIIFIFGGDGTVFHSLPILEKLDSPIIPIPVGSANDLATSMGIKNNVKQIIEIVHKGQIESLDLIRMNDQSFATVGGIGLGAEVVDQFNKSRSKGIASRMMRKLCPHNIYKSLVLKNALATDKFTGKYRIQANGNDLFTESSALFVSNISKLGGNLTLAPGANPSDGLFDIIVAPRLEPALLVKSFLEMNSGKIPRSFKKITTDHCRIESLSKVAPLSFADGEITGRTRILDFSCLPNSLKICR